MALSTFNYTSHLVCPDCHRPLTERTEHLLCAVCRHRFSQKDGRVFFASHTAEHPTESSPDALIVRCKNFAKRFPRLYRACVAFFGLSVAGVSPARFVREYTSPEYLILNLGSGASERYGNAVHVDLYSVSGVDVVADISRLPFGDGTVDAIICTQTLEHIADPNAVVREIERILRPGGLCYITVPFLYPYHSSPHDYYRWTLSGLRMLLSNFKEIKSGIRFGPTSALAINLAYWLAAITSFGSGRLFELFTLFWMLILAPPAHVFDFPLSRFRVSENMASGYYMIIKKPAIGL